MRISATLLVVAAVMALPLLPLSALAQEGGGIVASPPVDRSVTIYRAPQRNGGAIVLSRLGGFAVITETRQVTLPAGQARLSFTGVADGIIPESAIISGLPGGVIEKNQDDAVLSPSALMRAAVGRQVELHRTDRKTGREITTPVQLVSASAEGVIFATAQGEEALRCSGLAETFGYSSGGEGLYAQPTLSVMTRSARPVHAQVKLTYIAENFDWNASYIAHIATDGKTLDLTGWITLANGNSVSLPDAQTQIVAGGLNRADIRRFINDRPQVIARCWPRKTTSDIPAKADRPYELVHPWMNDGAIMVTARRMMMTSAPPPPPPPPSSPPAMAMDMVKDKATTPVAEQLGDLKLYRVPMRTNIAARQMKQTQLIDQAGVAFMTYYRVDVPAVPWMGNSLLARPFTTMVRTRNDKAHHLGLPLPAGAILVQQDQGGQVMLLTETTLHDTAENEKLELAVGPANDITISLAGLSGDGTNHALYKVTATNGSPHAAAMELRLPVYDGWTTSADMDAPKVDGVPTIKLNLASGGKQNFTITMTRQ